LQGFPEEWCFLGRKTAKYRQIGNAFPPPVAEAVGNCIKTAIDKVCQNMAIHQERLLYAV
jgi:DNA (cytosine-5)-methyltransferase 1